MVRDSHFSPRGRKGKRGERENWQNFDSLPSVREKEKKTSKAAVSRDSLVSISRWREEGRKKKRGKKRVSVWAIASQMKPIVEGGEGPGEKGGEGQRKA